MSDTDIELRGIVKSYGNKQVLTGLDLAVPKGSAAVGVLLTYIAYRRWLAADFD